MTTKQKKQMLALAKFVDAEYENYWSVDGGNAICEKCFRDTVLMPHKKSCVFGIAHDILKANEKKARKK